MQTQELTTIEMLGGKLMELNTEESRKLHEKYPEDVQINLCYNNMFMLSVAVFKMGAKVAYGYMEASPGIYVRHAFATKDNQVIDPMICLWDNVDEKKPRKYIVLKEFDTHGEYIDELMKNKRNEGYDADMRITMGESFSTFVLEAMHTLRNIIFVD